MCAVCIDLSVVFYIKEVCFWLRNKKRVKKEEGKDKHSDRAI